MCGAYALALAHVLSSALGVRWCKKNIRHGANLGLILPLIYPLSFRLSLDCLKSELLFRPVHVVASEGAVHLSSSSSVSILGIKNLVWQRAPRNRVLCGKGVEGFALLVGAPWFFSCWKTEANAATPAPRLWLPMTGRFSGVSISSIRWRALPSRCLLLPWTVRRYSVFLFSESLHSITCLCWACRVAQALEDKGEAAADTSVCRLCFRPAKRSSFLWIF